MKFSDIIIIVLFILSLIFGLWYLFGNSPTFEQAVLVFILGAIFTMAIKITQIGTELRIFRKSFINLVKDLKEDKFRK